MHRGTSNTHRARREIETEREIESKKKKTLGGREKREGLQREREWDCRGR